MQKIVIYEGAKARADELVLELIHAGFACEARRVETPEDFGRQLELHFPDVVLCGVSPPGSNAQAVLAQTRTIRPESSLIFVFGTVGEELVLQGIDGEPGDNVFKTSRADFVSTFARAIEAASERRRQANEERTVSRLSRLYADQSREIDRLRRQHVDFRKLSRFLKASASPSEVFAALESLGPELFRNTMGCLYLQIDAGMHFEAMASWGCDTPIEPTLTARDCWALRQTQAHWVRDPRTELVCSHVVPEAGPLLPYFCVPLFSDGAMLGLLHLRYLTDDSRTPADVGSMESGLTLATAVAEDTGMALANLKVRDTLHERSVRDSLTGLYNRRFLEEFLLRELARANRKKHPLAVIALDIDHFKRINDSAGHGAGDIVLRRIALLLQGQIRTSDIACRVGGEEFSLLLPEASMQIATQRAEAIREAVHNLKIRYEDHSLSGVTISLGVAAFPEHGMTPEALIRAADKALYHAKERGRDRVVAAAA